MCCVRWLVARRGRRVCAVLGQSTFSFFPVFSVSLGSNLQQKYDTHAHTCFLLGFSAFSFSGFRLRAAPTRLSRNYLSLITTRKNANNLCVCVCMCGVRAECVSGGVKIFDFRIFSNFCLLILDRKNLFLLHTPGVHVCLCVLMEGTN